MIQYFKHENGLSLVAIGQEFSESITFWQSGVHLNARLELEQNLTSIKASYYQSAESGYQPCNQDKYLKARLSAQDATAQFFGERPEFQTPPVNSTALIPGVGVQPAPVTVTLCTGEALVNDLPF